MAIKTTKSVSKTRYRQLLEDNEVENINKNPSEIINHTTICYHLSKKYGLPQQLIEKIVESQFELTKQLLDTEDKPSVKISYFGTFKMHQYRRKFNELVKKYGRVNWRKFEH
jgi:nucleoid DNA-binding protein